MPRFTKFTFEKALDVAHIQYLPGALETPADVATFAKEIDAALSTIGRKVDIIIGLGDLVIKPAAVAAYDKERLRMFELYALHAYRYGGSALVRTKILTSSTIHNQASNVYATFEEARNALLEDRKRAH